MTRRRLCDFLVASCVPEGGILRYSLFADGSVLPVDRIAMPSPMFFTQAGGRLWAVLRDPFADSEDSGIAAFDPRSGDCLQETVSTRGAVGCHLAVDGEAVFVANYFGGSVFGLPERLIRHHGRGVDPARQEAPHPHSVFFSPDRRYLLSCDLGLDTVFVYNRQLQEISHVRVPDGVGPRHLCFSSDGGTVYCINEMGASISVLSYRDGTLSYQRTFPLREGGLSGKGSAILPTKDGQRLYVTERAAEEILLLSAEGERLSILGRYDSHGVEPRDIALVADERFLIAANQFSDNLSVYRVGEEGALEYLSSIPVPAPICVAEWKK